MKGAKGTALNYGASYWTMANTLNSNSLNPLNSNAKFSVFNDAPVTDLMAVFPDTGTNTLRGGCLSGDRYGGTGWVWLERGIWGGAAQTALAGFATSRDLGFAHNLSGFCGWSSSIWSAQSILTAVRRM